MAKSIIYNVSGPNARANIGSTDNSINVVNVNPAIIESIKKLRQEIENSVSSSEQQKDALELADAIEQQFDSQTPSKTVLRKLVTALPDAGNIASIGSFILSCLGR